MWLENYSEGIKLEIGCSVKPDPYGKKKLKSYIQEYLEITNQYEIIEQYSLKDVEVNTLDIRRTFVDKLMSVKRHTVCGNIKNKVRHIYDVTMLYKNEEIIEFLSNKEELKKIIALTKQTDAFYLTKRNLTKSYNSLEPYDFDKWRVLLDNEIKKVYENLHNIMLYTTNKQNFDEAINTFSKINEILASIGE